MNFAYATDKDVFEALIEGGEQFTDDDPYECDALSDGLGAVLHSKFIVDILAISKGGETYCILEVTMLEESCIMSVQETSKISSEMIAFSLRYKFSDIAKLKQNMSNAFMLSVDHCVGGV